MLMLKLETNVKNPIAALVKRYLCMSQKGTVVFAEETVSFVIANYYREKGNLEEALVAISKGIDQFPFSAELIAFKATLLIEQGQEDEVVLTYLDHALELAPNEVRILLVKAEVFCNAERLDEALAILDFLKTFAQKKELEKIYSLEAHIQDLNEDYHAMFDSLSETLQINPHNQEALMQMWLATSLSERYEESIALHDELLVRDAYSYQAWMNTAHAYMGLEKYEEAIDAFELAIVANEDFEYAYLDCGMVCLQIGRYEQALKVYQDMIERFGESAESATKIGLCYQQLDDHVAATSWYVKALHIDVQNSEAHYRIGECLMLREDYDNAIKAFNKAIQIDGQFEEYYLGLARAYEKKKELDKAEEAYYRLIEVAPERTEHWLYHVNFLRHNQGFEAALEILDEAELNISRNADLLYSRAICLFEMGRRYEALHFLQEALSEDFALHAVLFEELPHLEGDKDVLDLIRFYR
jgi:tetratricopeptide (TPR) repeat protein